MYSTKPFSPSFTSSSHLMQIDRQQFTLLLSLCWAHQCWMLPPFGSLAVLYAHVSWARGLQEGIPTFGNLFSSRLLQSMSQWIHTSIILYYPKLYQNVSFHRKTSGCIGSKVCQMLSWRTKNSLHSINIWDTVTNVVPLHSVDQAPSYEPSFTLLAGFLRNFAFLSMLFILEVLCTVCSAEHLKNK